MVSASTIDAQPYMFKLHNIVDQKKHVKNDFQGTRMSFGVDVCMSFEEQLYLNLPEVQKALHANRTKLPYEWSMCSRYSIT